MRCWSTYACKLQIHGVPHGWGKFRSFILECTLMILKENWRKGFWYWSKSMWGTSEFFTREPWLRAGLIICFCHFDENFSHFWEKFSSKKIFCYFDENISHFFGNIILVNKQLIVKKKLIPYFQNNWKSWVFFYSSLKYCWYFDYLWSLTQVIEMGKVELG